MRSLLLLPIILLLLAPTASATVAVGIAEQQPSFFNDRLFKQTGIKKARLIVPWDVMQYDWGRAELDVWLSVARREEMNVLVSFGKSRLDNQPLPSPSQYGQAVESFRQQYPWVRNFSTWNEPNLGKTRKRPLLVARYYQELRRRCSDCQVLAAEPADTPGFINWIEAFKKGLDEEPNLWGLHNYLDTNLFSDRNTEAFLEAVKGRIWLSETGGIIDRSSIFSRVDLPKGFAHHRRATEYLLDRLVYISPRIERVYLYHWQAEPDGDAWDSAFVSSSGEARQSYDSLIKRVDPKSGDLTIIPEVGPKAPEPAPAERPIEIINP